MNDILIDELEINTRALHALKRGGIFTFADLAEKVDSLTSVRNCGAKTIMAIHDGLKKWLEEHSDELSDNKEVKQKRLTVTMKPIKHTLIMRGRVPYCIVDGKESISFEGCNIIPMLNETEYRKGNLICFVPNYGETIRLFLCDEIIPFALSKIN